MLSVENRPKFTMQVLVATAAIQGTMTATFLAHSRSEMKALEEKCDKDGSGVDGVIRAITTEVHEVSFPQLRLPTWTDLNGALNALLDWPGVAPAMQTAYFKGMWEAKAKNSETPPSGS